MSDIAVVIVSWNCRRYLRTCLQSLLRTGGEQAHRIVVVDNASSDRTPEMLRTEFPGIDLVEAGRNLGFAAANNLGMRECREEYLLLLNPDTEVQPDALSAMASFLDGHDNVWAVGPTILNGDGSLQRTGVRFPRALDLFAEAVFLDRLFPRSRLWGAHRELFAEPALARRVDYVQGSCLMVRRQRVLERVGPLDEGYFMYFEETDWCRRIRDQGGETWICPEARVIHYGGGEAGHYDEVRVVHYHRSLLRFMAKHEGVAAGLLVRLVIALRVILRCLLWLGMALLNPGGMRKRALSALRGYLRSIPLLFTEPLVAQCSSR